MSASPDAHREPEASTSGQADAAQPQRPEPSVRDATRPDTASESASARVSVDPLGATDRYRLSMPGDDGAARRAPGAQP
jgi:hypothetical protein